MFNDKVGASDEQRRLAKEATRLLRSQGCNGDGRIRGEVPVQQRAFEQRLVLAPFRGASR